MFASEAGVNLFLSRVDVAVAWGAMVGKVLGQSRIQKSSGLQ